MLKRVADCRRASPVLVGVAGALFPLVWLRYGFAGGDWSGELMLRLGDRGVLLSISTLVLPEIFAYLLMRLYGCKSAGVYGIAALIASVLVIAWIWVALRTFSTDATRGGL